MNTPSAANPTPESRIGVRRSVSAAIATPTTMPASDPACPHCSLRRYIGWAASSPISSVSHATSAPLWNVANNPHNAWEIIATANEPDSPSTMKAAPEPTSPITTDNRRLTVSATTPVGTSNSRYDSSSTVPISSSCSGPSCNSTIRNTLKSTDIRRKAKPSPVA